MERHMIEINWLVYMISQHGSIHSRDDNNATPLHNAVNLGDRSYLNRLLELGADVNAADDDGKTPLHYSINCGNKSEEKLRLQWRTDVQVTDDNEETLLCEALERQEAAIVDILLRYGANVDAKDINNRTALHYSAFSGKASIVDRLLRHGANVHAMDDNNSIPLHDAAKCREVSIVDMLLRYGANVDARDSSNKTPLHEAAYTGEASIVDMLLRYGANVHAVDNRNRTSLHDAALRGNVLTVNILMRYGSNVFAKDTNDKTPLHEAALCGNISIVDCLLRHSANVHVKDGSNQTPLHYSVQSGKVAVVDMLLRHGANMYAKDGNDRTPLHEVALRGNVCIMDMLLSHSANTNVKDGKERTPLYEAARWGKVSIVQMLLQHGGNVHVTDYKGKTALHIAARYGEASIVDILLDHDADVHAVDCDGNTPLHIAARNGEEAIVRILIRHGANVHVTNGNKRTSLHEAAEYGFASITDLLLRHGANVDEIDRSSITPLHLAAYFGHKSVTVTLLHYSAKINAKNCNGATPLHLMVQSMEKSYVELLLKNGAKVNARNRNKDTPLHVAVQVGSAGIVELLLQHGAKVNAMNHSGITPLHLAATNNKTLIVRILLSYCANVHATDGENNTPLHEAAHHRDASIVNILLHNGSYVNATNHSGTTPLHLAVSRQATSTVDLLLRHNADVTARDMHWGTALNVAHTFQANDKILSLLNTAERLTLHKTDRSHILRYISKSNNQVATRNNSVQDNELREFKYLKNSNSDVCGQLYETKLLSLVLIRALNDEQIDQFLLGTNIRGIGDMDDICLRYQVKGQQRPVLLFMQAKHRADCEKGKLTVEEVWNTSGDFSLRKYFESFLKIKERFQANNSDPMFEGDFGDVDCNLVIYTSAKDCFTEKKTKHKKCERVCSLTSTNQNSEIFQYDFNENDIHLLNEISVIGHVKQLGTNFLELIMAKKYKSDLILADKLIAKYHVVMGREVLQQCKTQVTQDYRMWEFRPDFFERDCKYLVALKKVFVEELSTKFLDQSKISSEDRVNIQMVLQDPCSFTISKVIGKLVTYNKKTQKLQLVNNFQKEFKADILSHLLKQFDEMKIHEYIINDAIQVRLKSLKIKLPLSFGNLDITFRGNKDKVKRRMEYLANKLISLFKLTKDTKVVDINENVLGPGRTIEHGILDMNGGIGSAVGNLLVLDTKTKMLKFNLNNEALPENATMFLKELRKDKYKPVNEELSSYRFKISVFEFPNISFDEDDYNKTQALFFFNSLWFYANQAKEDEVEDIIMEHINKFYNKERRDDDCIFKILSKAIFLSSHEQIQKWWMQTSTSCYLTQENDIFERAKLARICNVLVIVVNHILESNIYSIDFETNYNSNKDDRGIQMGSIFSTILQKLFKKCNMNKNSNKINLDTKDIVNLLQTNEKLAIENNLTSRNKAKTPSLHPSSKTPYTISKHQMALRKNDRSNAQFMYLKRAGTSGVCGQLYETKLLTLVLIRALNDDTIENFHLGTNIRCISYMDDICLRYQVSGQHKPVALFVQAKHREDCEKSRLTIEDLRNENGNFSLRKYFKTYLTIKNRFEADNMDPMFDGNFDAVECHLIVYTSVKDCFSKKKTGHKICEKVHYLLNSGKNTDLFQYEYNNDDIYFLTEFTVLEELQKLGTAFLEAIMSKKTKCFKLMDKLISRYNVVMGREVLQQCRKQESTKYRIWEFRHDFFERKCNYLSFLQKIFVKELSTKCFDEFKLSSRDKINFKMVLQDPCASTIRNLIGSLATYNEKTKKLQLLPVFQKELKADNLEQLLNQFHEMEIDENVVTDAIKMKLKSMKIKLPLAFGNLDMIFHGNEAKVKRRMEFVAKKLMNLFILAEDTKVVDINDVLESGMPLEYGITDIIGGIGSAVGNLLILDTKTRMLKLDLDNEALPKNAALFLKELKNDKYEPANKELSSYRIKINIDGFPKDSFNGDDYDNRQARDFLGTLWFYANQAKENEVECILKEEISKYYFNKSGPNVSDYGIFIDSVFLSSHDEVQKWWIQTCDSTYLDRASELFERAKREDMNNLLLTVINFMYISKIHSINVKCKQYANDETKYEKMYLIFNKMSDRLFNLFDSEFNETISIDLSDISATIHYDLRITFLIDPEMKSVSLYMKGGSCFLHAEVVPGSGRRQGKAQFSLTQIRRHADGVLVYEDLLRRSLTYKHGFYPPSSY